MQLVGGKARLLLPFAGVFTIAILWQAASSIVADSTILPSPGATLLAAGKHLANGYGYDLLATATRACVALVLALAAGIPAGLILGWSERLYDSFRGVLAFLRSLPAFLLLTIPIALGHSGETARIVTTAVASAWIIADESAESLRTVARDRIEVLQAFRASSAFIVTRLLFFEALGRVIVPTIRTNIGICFIVVIVVESLAIPATGVGARLLTWLSASDMAGVWGFLLLTGLAGVLLNTTVHALAKRLVFWT